MKKQITIAVLLLFSIVVFGQKPITLKPGNIIVSNGTVMLHSAAITGVQLPGTGSDKGWDYSNLTGGAAISPEYTTNISGSFSKTAIIQSNGNGMFTPYETYPANKVFDKDKNGYFYAGDNVPYYASELEEVTGDANDVLIIPAQNDVISSRDDIIKFPATSGDNWTSSYNKTLKFTLTLEFLGMYNVPCTEVSYTTVKNTVVGWGNLETPASTTNEKSRESDVLMIRREVITTDSIFLNGVAAPDWLMSAFYTAQGAATTVSYTESFYSNGGFTPVITFNFASDNTYSTLAGITYLIKGNDESANEGPIILKKDLFGNKADNELNVMANTTTNLNLYPNPVVNGAVINCQFNKPADGTWNVNVSNIVGQVVKTIPVNGTGNITIPIETDGMVKNGIYILKIITEKGNLQASAKFNISK
jgi:hypothetical protein